jgi:hydroxymethylpyrimidine pyrophosphatase-like HAD family hydrolase
MDGTLLNAYSRVDPASARVIRAAVEERGVRVVVATGKARPAALAAAREAGLEGVLCSERGPGVYLQGLAVHGARGEPLSDACLPPALVRSALLWAERERVPLCVFLGDECATLRLLPGLHELHARYYEPLAAEYACADGLLERAAMVGGARKLLFLAPPDEVAARVEPYWRRELEAPPAPAPPFAPFARGGAAPDDGRRAGKGRASTAAAARPFAGLAAVTVAVPGMLEVVPAGVDKWRGLRTLLASLGVRASEVVAVGDGANDLEMVAGAGWGVAMGNAVPAVKAAARAVVARHDEGGIVEAFERFVL